MNDQKETMRPSIKNLSEIAGSKRARGLNLTEAEGVELIKAHRRGVSSQKLAEAVGIKHRGNLYNSVGTWAFKYAKVDSAE